MTLYTWDDVTGLAQGANFTDSRGREFLSLGDGWFWDYAKARRISMLLMTEVSELPMVLQEEEDRGL